MGAYLSNPVIDKESEDGAGNGMRYGVSSMQGWRVNMEDAHIVQPELMQGSGVGLYAVFDGHGGKEVAAFCAKYFPDEFRSVVSQGGSSAQLQSILPQLFHRMDAMLREEQYAFELQLLSKSKEDAAKAGGAGAGAGAGGGAGASGGTGGGGGGGQQAASMVRTSINSSLEEARKKGKLTQKEAMELMVNMMTLQRMEAKPNSAQPPNGAAGGAKADDSSTCAGCTANVAVVTPTEILVANAGDSRAVIASNGGVVALSKDHKPNLPEERERITKAGGWITDGATGHYRVNGNLNLSRSIGDLKYKTDARIGPEAQVVTAEPDVVRHTRTAQDEFLVLACDGVWDCLTNEEVAEFTRRRLREGAKCSEICEEIFTQCLAEDPKQTAGIGGDNMTCIIVDLRPR